jgi:hypothetical protein
MPEEHCALCGCMVHRTGAFGEQSVRGRSHATAHHFVAERFFPRTASRSGSKRYRYAQPREGIFQRCPWNMRGKTAVFCYECHEELLHNPVLLPEDIRQLAELVRRAGFDEIDKPATREHIAGRIQLFHTVIQAGLTTLLSQDTSSEINTSSTMRSTLTVQETSVRPSTDDAGA